MTKCPHQPRYPDPTAVPSVDACLAMCSIGQHPAHAEHPLAVTVPEGQRTHIDGAFWDRCGPLQRASILSHERGHVLLGLDCPCESCADKMGGYIMRVWGFTSEAIASGYGSLDVRRDHRRNLWRDAPASAAEGAAAATRGLAARGLLGSVPSRELLLKSKASSLDSKSVAIAQANAARTTTPVDHALTTSLNTTRATSPAAAVDHTAPATSGALVAVVGAPAGGGPKVVITDPSFVSSSPSQKDELATQVKVQVVAGIIVAIVLAVVLGRA